MGKGGEKEECALIIPCCCCCLVVGPFTMMIVVLTMKDSIAWNSYIARPDLLCDDFGFVSVHQRTSFVWLILVCQVPKPYYLEMLILGVTQFILKIISSDAKHRKAGPNRLEVLYILFQIVICWGSTISIFNAFPLHNDFPTTDGWYDYNMVVYMFSCSSACITGLQFWVNGFMIIFEQGALGDKFEKRWNKMIRKEENRVQNRETFNKNDTDSTSGTAQASGSGAAVEMGEGGSTKDLEKKGCMCGCFSSVKDFFKEPVECFSECPLYLWFLCSGTFMLLPILPALVTHYFAMVWAYFWMFLPCFAAVLGILMFLNWMADEEALGSKGLPKCCEPFILVAVRCLLVFVALFVFQAPMEIGCFLYGYSLDEMPADGNEYTGAIDQWWHTRDTAAYFDCVADRTSDSAGAVFDVLSWF